MKNFCLFIGYPRSGHSIVGSLLDAHPNMIFSHEADSVYFVERGYSQHDIFTIILRNSRDFARVGRGWSDRSHELPGQWQGKYDHLLVIGDKHGGRTTKRISDNPQLLDQITETINCQIQWIHHVRNPFDMLATASLRFGSSDVEDHLVKTMGNFFETVDAVCKRVDPACLFEGRHEDFISDPRDYVARLCQFLGVTAPDDYLNSCAAIVNSDPSRSRQRVRWSEPQIRSMDRMIERYPFLQGYSFTD